MKQRLIHIIFLLLVALSAASQTTIKGVVTDGRESLAGVNVFIVGTIDGCLTDSLGRFSFQTSKTGEMTLRATYIGFDDYTLAITDSFPLTIRLHERAMSIDEVTVTASTYSFGKSENFKTMNALDVVMSGNSCGDIVAALQTLPCKPCLVRRRWGRVASFTCEVVRAMNVRRLSMECTCSYLIQRMWRTMPRVADSRPSSSKASTSRWVAIVVNMGKLSLRCCRWRPPMLQQAISLG